MLFLLLSPATSSSDFTYSREYKTFRSTVSRLNGQQCPDDSFDFCRMASLTIEQISCNLEKDWCLNHNNTKNPMTTCNWHQVCVVRRSTNHDIRRQNTWLMQSAQGKYDIGSVTFQWWLMKTQEKHFADVKGYDNVNSLFFYQLKRKQTYILDLHEDYYLDSDIIVCFVALWFSRADVGYFLCNGGYSTKRTLYVYVPVAGTNSRLA